MFKQIVLRPANDHYFPAREMLMINSSLEPFSSAVLYHKLLSNWKHIYVGWNVAS